MIEKIIDLTKYRVELCYCCDFDTIEDMNLRKESLVITFKKKYLLKGLIKIQKEPVRFPFVGDSSGEIYQDMHKEISGLLTRKNKSEKLNEILK